ncbi:hypothetical protein ACIHFE_04455 [Streptomyces sp. NPDC052396]|uniref:hypothetical protein n=1 Tax=Streptomyces sp. NPDC052396 TaxID=3365689 RepID=UPI0037D17335
MVNPTALFQPATLYAAIPCDDTHEIAVVDANGGHWDWDQSATLAAIRLTIA